jgi:hypothetical protein
VLYLIEGNVVAAVMLSKKMMKLMELIISPFNFSSSGGRRCSTRDFFSDINSALFQMESMAEHVDSWALTLATSVVDQAICMDMDIVFVGHVDGCVFLAFHNLHRYVSHVYEC